MSYAFLSSAQEQSATSNNIFFDSDQDGLSDEEEETYGTDPKNTDTDGDSYTDGTEIKSGYDPLKPAPGDRLIPETVTAPTKDNGSADEKNLTEEVAVKISDIAKETDNENKTVSLEEIKTIVEQSMSGQINETDLPLITEEEIKIKKQDYDTLPTEKAQTQKKEDFIDYIVATSYIMSSNSPVPITSDADLSAISQQMMTSLNSIFIDNDQSALNELAGSGQKIFDQMKEIEVPEEMADMHLKGLRFASYAMRLKEGLIDSQDDPLSKIATLSKVQALLDEFAGFITDSEEKFMLYGLQTDNALDEKLDSLGILPIIPEVENPEEDTIDENQAE